MSRAPLGSITDVPGIRVGHHRRIGRGWRTGTTVVLASHGAVGGVDVRGGGPGTRETDLLAPENLVQQVNAVCLSGGSAYGLSTADGVMRWLEAHDSGFRVGDAPGAVVPIVPTAVIFDLGRGGSFANRPDADFGWRAAASAARRPARAAGGSVGAGTGAVAGGLQGGVGTASITLDDGTVVGALAVVNAAGSTVDPDTGLPWEAGRAPWRLVRPDRSERDALRDHLRTSGHLGDAPLNTTIGVVATSARLTKPECSKLATVAHDGMARAVRPAHSMNDGDTVFALATGRDDLVLPVADPAFRSKASRVAALNRILSAGAETFSRAVTEAVLAATRHPGGPPAYGDLCPSVRAAWTARHGMP